MYAVGRDPDDSWLLPVLFVLLVLLDASGFVVVLTAPAPLALGPSLRSMSLTVLG